FCDMSPSLPPLIRSNTSKKVQELKKNPTKCWGFRLQLAHAPRNAVSAAYNHALYLGPRAKMMQDCADLLE
ncbi:MAG TPA: hypothetical protein VND66_14385, partial [Acidobacteriaceae bacterium]|nr:hypothetical protein [Acidobacteriaceae bacterium]